MTRTIAEKWKRLRGMATREVAYRVRERIRTEADRIWFGLMPSKKVDLHGAGDGFDGKSAASFRQYLQGEPARRFYLPSSPAEREKLGRFVSARFPEWKQKAIGEAERLCEHRLELLGFGEVELGRKIDWHRDPVTGRIWPRRFWADYDLVYDNSAGDPKSVHELNRHQHLPRLGKAFFLTGDERYAREAIRQMTSWVEQNPPGVGVHWHSSLEIALRAISWMWTIFFVLPADSFDEDSARKIGGSLLAQLDHVYRYPSVYSSPNTHILGEAAALFIGGLVFSECNRGSEWKALGASLLTQEMDKQVSDEGIHGELSSYYHCYALDFYLQALILANRNGFSFPKQVWKQAGLMTDFVMHITRPGGSIPLLGDDDGGRALAMDQTGYRSFRDALCTGAVLCGRPDWKHQACGFLEETLWLLGESAWNAYQTLRSTPPAVSGASYRDAGYFIQRSGWSPLASHLIFDCGNLGMINGGHGHADALSVILSAGGKDLLVDPGTCVYNAAAEWRNFFRSTGAHNTAVVDGREQSETGGTFRWMQQAQSRVVRDLTLEAIQYVEGEHNGYSRLPQGVIHRRRVLYCKPDYWVIVDDFQGEGEHDFDLYYHFGADAQVSFDERAGARREMEILFRVPGAGLQLFLAASAPIQVELIRGQQSPIQGWTSVRYGEKKPAPTLRLTLRAQAPAAIVSVLAPFVGDSGRRPSYEISGMTATGEAIACTVQYWNRKDLVVYPIRDEEVVVANCEMRGELFWFRTDRGAPKRLFAVNARRMDYNGRELLCDGVPRSHVWQTFGSRCTVPEELGEVCAGYAEL